MKILYCIAGHGIYGVLESEITSRVGSCISAKRIFSLEANPSQVVMAKGQTVNFAIAIYDNAEIFCSFISNMSEKALFYQEIAKFIRKEAASEN